VRALLLKDTGQPDEALRWFSSFSDLSVYDLAYLGPAHFHRAQLLESKSEYVSAAEDYRRLVELWDDPDPELPWMVDLARERLRALTALGD
jgi:tetratricopeptide (TPR) repeat protein